MMGEKCFQPEAVVANGLTADVILGLDFLEANCCTIDLGEKVLRFRDENLSVRLATCCMCESRHRHGGDHANTCLQ